MVAGSSPVSRSIFPWWPGGDCPGGVGGGGREPGVGRGQRGGEGNRGGAGARVHGHPAPPDQGRAGGVQGEWGPPAGRGRRRGRGRPGGAGGGGAGGALRG